MNLELFIEILKKEDKEKKEEKENRGFSIVDYEVKTEVDFDILKKT